MYSVFFSPTGCNACSRKAAPTLQHFKTFTMNILRIIFNVCERLFEELVKELLKDRFSVVSGSFREVNGRRVRIRKAHLRKRKR